MILVKEDTYNPQKPRLEVYVAGDDPRYSDRITGPKELLQQVKVGDQVQVMCLITPRLSNKGAPYLNVWGVELVDHVPGELVGASNGKAPGK